MIFFIWSKNNVSFSRFLDFCAFVKSTDFKVCDVIISIATWWKFTLSLNSFWILNPIKMKFGQILMCCMINISNMFLVQCWRLETSPRPFHNLLKWQNSEIWPFLIVEVYHFWLSLVHLFKNMKHWTRDRFWLLRNWSRLLNWKGSGT